MTRRALVVGCGGTLGFAWSVAAIEAVEEALAWDAREAAVLVGTSAGSEIVAALGSGRGTADLRAALQSGTGADPVLARHLGIHPGAAPPLPRPRLPALRLAAAGIRARRPLTALAGLTPTGRGDATWLRRYGADLADDSGWVSHPATWVLAADITTGQVVPFGAPGAPAADLGSAIAASWAIPGWFPPVEIGGRRYLDGGAVSSASADIVLTLGHDVDEVVVVAPMTSEGGAPARGAARAERVLRSQMTRGLDREVSALRARGIRVVRVEPGAEDLAAMGPNFMDLRRRESTFTTAVRTAPDRVAAAIRTADRTQENR